MFRPRLAPLALLILAAAASAQQPRGMTWGSYENAATGKGVVFVGCHGKPRTQQGSCDAYVGDTACSVSLPPLCLRVDGRPRPAGLVTGKGYAMPPDFYAGWVQGEVRAGNPVAARACVRNSGAPWNEGPSVSTERQVAPPAS